MRNIFVSLQYPRYIFADYLYIEEKEEIHNCRLQELIDKDMTKIYVKKD